MKNFLDERVKIDSGDMRNAGKINEVLMVFSEIPFQRVQKHFEIRNTSTGGERKYCMCKYFSISEANFHFVM